MIESMLGIDSDLIIIGILIVTLILFILLIINMSRVNNLEKKYDIFMMGNDAMSLEDTLITRLKQVDELTAANEANYQSIDAMFMKQKSCFCKHSMVKYDAFDDMGGKMSCVLVFLNEKNNGYIMNNVHSREGGYTYIKDIIDGNSIVALSEEEEEALNKALVSEG